MIEYIDVQTFYKRSKDRLKLTLTTSENGFSRRIIKSDIHRPGLALAGFVELFTYDRVQVLGNTEIKYFEHCLKNNDNIHRKNNTDNIIAVSSLKKKITNDTIKGC